MELIGEVKEIIYQNEVNSYTVAEFETDEEEITIVGYLPFINVGDTLKLVGKIVTHQDYGEQFKVDTFEKTIPKSLSSLERYLANGTIKGVGPATAKKIVDTFGEETLHVLKFEPEKLSNIKGINKEKAINIITKETLLVVVDTHKTTYVEVPELLEKTNKIVVIDHHRRSTDFIENSILTFHEVYASSACELVTELLEYSENEINLTQLETEGLYAGIMMDTKNFTFKTGVRTFEAAAYLRKCGVDIIKVKKWFQSDLETYNKISEIVANAEITNDTIGISVYDKADSNSNVICAKAADELLTISDITASFVIGNLGNKICISGRSIGDINVQLILEKLGGGGHITLAGAQVEGMTIEEVKQELIIRINEYFSEIAN